MPVRKFRSVQAMNDAPLEARGDDAVARFLRHAARYRRLTVRTWLPGVVKFRSLEDAQQERRARSRRSRS